VTHAAGIVAAPMLAAVLGVPAVLLLARRTTLNPPAPRPLDAGAIAAVTGLTLGVVLLRPPADSMVLLPLVVLGCAAAVVDAREGRLPDALTRPMLVCTLLAGLLNSQDGLRLVVVAAAGAAIATLLKAMASAAIGWGDVKIAPTLAVVLVHHDAVVPGVVVMSLLVAVTAVAIALLGVLRAPDRGAVVPYGPGLVLGALGVAAF
jgi:leader peptidase (prepilin peptidase)/N-methyltransferase